MSWSGTKIKVEKSAPNCPCIIKIGCLIENRNEVEIYSAKITPDEKLNGLTNVEFEGEIKIPKTDLRNIWYKKHVERIFAKAIDYTITAPLN